MLVCLLLLGFLWFCFVFIIVSAFLNHLKELMVSWQTPYHMSSKTASEVQEKYCKYAERHMIELSNSKKCVTIRSFQCSHVSSSILLKAICSGSYWCSQWDYTSLGIVMCNCTGFVCPGIDLPSTGKWLSSDNYDGLLSYQLKSTKSL